jgi:hypothetical protein
MTALAMGGERSRAAGWAASSTRVIHSIFFAATHPRHTVCRQAGKHDRNARAPKRSDARTTIRRDDRADAGCDGRTDD